MKQTNTATMTLGELIQKKRLDNGYSQNQLSKVLGYKSGQFVSDWERGVSAPPIKKLKKLSTALNVKPKKLYDLLLIQAHEQVEKNMNKEFKMWVK